MSNVTVISRTQRIVVDPATSSVSVINAGPRGPAGPMGQGITIAGSNIYSAIIALPAPNVGDVWIQTTTGGGGAIGDGLLWNGTEWVNIGPIRGPAGAPGAASTIPGPQGPPGPNVPQFVQDTPPVANVTGDQWFNTSNGRQYVWYDDFWVEVGTSFMSNLLTVDGQLLTREAGELAPINRASLAADPAFSAVYASAVAPTPYLDSRYGLIKGYARADSQQTGITTVVDLTGLTCTFNAEAGRMYRLSAWGSFISTVNGDIVRFMITDGANNILMLSQNSLTTVHANGINTVQGWSLQTLTPGSITIKCRAQRASGTGTLTMNVGSTQPGVLIVEDVGPS